MAVTDMSAGRTLSKKAIACEFGIARETVSKILKDIDPAGERNGYPVWSLFEVSGPVSDYTRFGRYPSSGPDVGQMSAKERKDWFDSERLRLAVEATMGTLIDAEKHRAELASLAKIISGHLLTMADDMDAAFNLPADVVQSIEKASRDVLNLIADQLENAPDSTEEI